MAVATFRAGGLASGIDSNAIIEQLMAIEARPISILKSRQEGLRTQISTLGDINSKVSALFNAADALAKGGTLATKVDSTNTSFSAVSGSGAFAGRYELQVGTLASAARTRSAPVPNATDPLQGATLDLHVQGEDYQIAIGDGTTLADVAFAIRQSGAPVTATVINDGTQNFLSIVNNETGYPLGGPVTEGLSFTITPSPTATLTYQALALDPPTDASNASVIYNGITVYRTSNSISDVIPGVTLSLKSVTGTPEPLVLSNDQTATVANLQKFADAYNAVMKGLQSQLNISSGTDRDKVMAGDSSLRSLQSALQSLISRAVGDSENVRTLADIGIKSARDGSLSVDTATVAKAMTRDPGAVNSVFAHATEGVGVALKTLNTNYTKTTTGILTARKTGIQSRIDRMDDEIVAMERRLNMRREALIAQFTAMENIVSKLKSTGDFLSRQSFSIDNGE
jgi:flagellar hook-associated protein 2